MIMITIFFNFVNFCVIVSFFLTKLLKSDILVSTVERAVLVAKLVALGIFLLS